ncbi:hypothetical protein [Paraburkholderia sp. C35]|uniref:hypothetical protein n=1 Tax=Paraburkholderia sp. C35 TaxID=2126993 RepID=UPI0031BB912F
MKVPLPDANELIVTAPFEALIVHGPSKLKLAVYAPFEFAVALPLPFLHDSVMLAFDNAAPTAAVPLIVALGDEPPPPQANNVLLASAAMLIRKLRDALRLNCVIDYLQK